MGNNITRLLLIAWSTWWHRLKWPWMSTSLSAKAKITFMDITHDSDKYVVEDEWSEHNPEHNVKYGKHWIGHVFHILVNFQPPIQCKKLEQRDKCVTQASEIRKFHDQAAQNRLYVLPQFFFWKAIHACEKTTQTVKKYTNFIKSFLVLSVCYWPNLLNSYFDPQWWP